MSGPLIGITTSSAPGGDRPERVSLNTAYMRAVMRAGGVPVLLPPQLGTAQVEALLDFVDGVVLTGGGDIAPSAYTMETTHPAVTGVSVERDTVEAAVLRRAIADQKPVLAICRGMQMLNVVLGGTLHQHIPDAYGEELGHDQSKSGHARSDATHTVEVRGGSLLANLVGPGRLAVNSMHHQAIRVLGSQLIVSARSSDGLIEAIEAPVLGRFILGVQWHPEEMVSKVDAARALFTGLVRAAATPAEEALKVTEVRPEAAGEVVPAVLGRSRRLVLGQL